MVVVGGQAPKAIRSVECYDFQEDRWYQVADLPSRRCRAGELPPDAKIRIRRSNFEGGDEESSRWFKTDFLRHFLGVVSMGGRVFAVGGFNSSLRERTVDVYDGAKDQWESVASMQERRSTLGAAVLQDLLYAVGGFNGSIGTNPSASHGNTPFQQLLCGPDEGFISEAQSPRSCR